MNVFSAASKIKNSKRSDKGHKDRHSVGHEEESKTPEPHICIGHFQADFNELCRQNDIPYTPPIVPRARPPQPTIHYDSTYKHEKNKGRPLRTPTEHRITTPVIIEEDEKDPTPKTFVLKDNLEFFKPTIQIEMDNFDKPGTVSEVYIRGWKIDKTIMIVLGQCWVTMEKLHTVNLWNVGLASDTFKILTDAVNNIPNLRNLILDGNSLPDENWSELISEESSVKNLSLRHCCITDVGAEFIGKSLKTMSNIKLSNLNLTGNRITDKGAQLIVEGLRMNRTLLVLNMASNLIGDIGAIEIAKVLSYYPLTHEEIVERRKLMSEPIIAEDTVINIGRQTDGKDGGNFRPPSVNRKGSDSDRAKQGRTQTKRKDSKGKDDDKSKKKDDKGTKKVDRNNSLTDRRLSGTTVQQNMASTDKRKPRKSEDKKIPTLTLGDENNTDVNALTDAYHDETTGELVSGNKTLLSLNLSRNKIGERGIHALLEAMAYQADDKNKSTGTGLMRLCVTKNGLPSDHQLIKDLNEVMLKRGPFYKEPPKSPEE